MKLFEVYFVQTGVWVCVFMCLGQAKYRRTWLKKKFWLFQCPPIRRLNCPHAFSYALVNLQLKQTRAQTLYPHSSTNRLWLSDLFSDITWCGKEWLYIYISYPQIAHCYRADANTHLSLRIHMAYLEQLRYACTLPYTWPQTLLYFSDVLLYTSEKSTQTVSLLTVNYYQYGENSSWYCSDHFIYTFFWFWCYLNSASQWPPWLCFFQFL